MMSAFGENARWPIDLEIYGENLTANFEISIVGEEQPLNKEIFVENKRYFDDNRK